MAFEGIDTLAFEQSSFFNTKPRPRPDTSPNNRENRGLEVKRSLASVLWNSADVVVGVWRQEQLGTDTRSHIVEVLKDRMRDGLGHWGSWTSDIPTA